MSVLASVSSDGVVSDWPLLRREILDAYNSHLPPISCRDSDCMDDMKNFINDWISSLEEPPIAIQRLCEILSLLPTRSHVGEERFIASIERIISSSHFINKSRMHSIIKKRSSDVSDTSSVYDTSSDFDHPPSSVATTTIAEGRRKRLRYSDSMLTRTLKRKSRSDF